MADMNLTPSVQCRHLDESQSPKHDGDGPDPPSLCQHPRGERLLAAQSELPACDMPLFLVGDFSRCCHAAVWTPDHSQLNVLLLLIVQFSSLSVAAL